MAYNVIETTKVTGLCYDFINDEVDIENGSPLKKGDIVDGERNIYEVEAPKKTDKIYVAANPAWDYDNSHSVNQNEERFINKMGKPFRGYGLNPDDKFGIEDYAITDGTDINKGDYITIDDGADYKFKKSGTTLPEGYGFVGKVTEVEEYGFQYAAGTAGNVGASGKRVVIEVVQNENVASGD